MIGGSAYCYGQVFNTGSWQLSSQFGTAHVQLWSQVATKGGQPVALCLLTKGAAAHIIELRLHEPLLTTGVTVYTNFW